MDPALSVQDLSLSFGSHPAVKGLSFTIGRGETVALVGESGSGKSATALAILRLIEREGGRITGGRIVVHGAPDTDLTAAPPAVLRALRGNRVAMIFQEPMTALNPVMRLGEQVAEVLRLHRGLSAAQARAEAIAAFARVRIPDPERRAGQYPHELSGGLRQRVMIAMALACRPDLLIADEPTTALDVTTQAEILRLIRDLQAETGMSLLFITHDMGVVAEIADRVVVLRQGEKVEEGPAATLFARPAADYTRMLVAASPRLGSGAAERYPHQFSGGQRQRLCIARALSVQPALIVADEPVSALDVSVARQVTDLMADLQARDGVAFLFISHDMAVVERVSHRIAVMQAGRIVETGPTAQVLANPAHPYTRRLLAAVPVPDPARSHRLRSVLPPLAEPPALLLPRGGRPPRGRMAEVAPGHWVLADSDPAFRFAAALAGAGAQGADAAKQVDREPAGSIQP